MQAMTGCCVDISVAGQTILLEQNEFSGIVSICVSIGVPDAVIVYSSTQTLRQTAPRELGPLRMTFSAICFAC